MRPVVSPDNSSDDDDDIEANERDTTDGNHVKPSVDEIRLPGLAWCFNSNRGDKLLAPSTAEISKTITAPESNPTASSGVSPSSTTDGLNAGWKANDTGKS